MGDNNLRYLPHTLNTRFHAVKTYRSGNILILFVENIKFHQVR